jgi:hypothetical protein
MNPQAHTSTPGYQLHFEPLHDQGSALSFPCDATGHVTMDELPAKALNNYLLARTVIGCRFRYPVVQTCCRGLPN